MRRFVGSWLARARRREESHPLSTEFEIRVEPGSLQQPIHTTDTLSEALRSVWNAKAIAKQLYGPVPLDEMFTNPRWREEANWRQAVRWLEEREAAAEEWPWPNR